MVLVSIIYLLHFSLFETVSIVNIIALSCVITMYIAKHIYLFVLQRIYIY